MFLFGKRIGQMVVICSMISLFILISKQTISQVTITSPATSISNTTDLTTYSFASFTPTAGSILVVFVVATGTLQTNPTITNTGTTLTWTLDAVQIVSGNGYYIFWARVPATVSASVVSFNCTTDGPDGVNMSIFSCANTNRFSSDPLIQTKISTAGTNSTNANITFDKALRPRSGYIVAWSGLFTANNNSTAPTGFTEVGDLGRNTPAKNLAAARRDGGLSTAGPITFTNAITTWVVMGAEVDWVKRDMPLSLLNN
jgi:hypothetical protein